MKEPKEVLSVRLDKITMKRLKDLSEKYRKSMRETIEHLINKEYVDTDVLCINSGNGFIRGRTYPVISENNGITIVNEDDEELLFFDYVTNHETSVLANEDEENIIAEFIRLHNYM